MLRVLIGLATGMLSVFAAAHTHAQVSCAGGWAPGSGVPTPSGQNNFVYAITGWDPDGPGPATPKVVVGGTLAIAPSTTATNIAVFDPATGNWSGLGTGLNGEVDALAVMPNGDLIAGGQFTVAGGASATYVARWNGTAWSALGSGLSGRVRALAVMSNGDLVAGGFFTTAGGTAANRVARWNGTTWSALGTGLDSAVYTLAALPNNNLVVGGFFTSAGGTPANRIARWNGSAWSAMGSGMNDIVVALTVMPNGDLIAGGSFLSAGGVIVNGVARWNGTAWSALSTGLAGTVYQGAALAALPNGDLYVGGAFTSAGGISARNIARWNGSAWSALGAGANGNIFALAALPGNQAGAGGSFTVVDGTVTSLYFARYRTSSSCSIADVTALGGASGACPDGQISTDDLIGFLAAFFNGNLAIADIARLGGTLGGDGQISADDLIVFLRTFFTGCP